MNEFDYKKTYKKLIRRYLVASAILVILFVTRQIIIQYQINHEKNMSTVINVSGRQRMLSQKIAKDMLMIVQEKEKEEISYFLGDMKEALSILKKSQNNLIHGNEQEGLSGENSEVIDYMFQDMEPDFQNMIQLSNNFLTVFESNNFNKSELYEIVKESGTYERSFLEKMDDIVFRYDYESKKAIGLIEAIELILFAMIVLAMLFVAIFVFLPVGSILKTAFWEVNENNENIIKLFNTMKGALFLIKYDGEVLLMNSDAERIVTFSYLQLSTLNLKTHIKWMSIDIEQLIETLKTEEQIDNIEFEIDYKDGERHNVILSAVKGIFKGNDIILISMFDNTKQKKAEELLKSAAVKDQLTGLYNRRFLDTIIDDEIGRAERYEIPLSAFMLDLDHFKEINDQWGHPVGDAVLKMTSEILMQNTRMSDYLLRIGGEEFIVLMPNTNIDGAYKAAEKVRKAIEDSIHPVVGQYTASFGVAERTKGETYRNLYKRIDDALYRAKEAGRNCVIASEAQNGEGASFYLTWKEKWNSGESVIDEQHRELFRMAGNFIDNQTMLEDREKALQNFDIIISHIYDHFQYEESILKKINYSDYLKHKDMHSALLEKGEKIREKTETKKVELSDAFLFLFDEVIVGHLLKEDVKFFPYLENI